jgi:hypothetical protein
MRQLSFGGIEPKTKSQNNRNPAIADVSENVRLYGSCLQPIKSPVLSADNIVDVHGVKISDDIVVQSLYQAGNIWVGFQGFVSIIPDVIDRFGEDSFLYVLGGGLYRQSGTRIAQKLPPVKLGICPPLTAPKVTVLVGGGCKDYQPSPVCQASDFAVECSPMTPYADAPDVRAYAFIYRTDAGTCHDDYQRSAPSPVSLLVDVHNSDAVILAAMDTPPANAAYREWYRIVGTSDGDGEFFYIGETAINVPVFVDKLCPQELGELLNTDRHYPPPCLSGVAQVGNKVVAVWHGQDIWFSEVGLPHAYMPTSRYTLGYEIVRVVGVTPWVEGDTHFMAVALTKGKQYAIGGRSAASSYADMSQGMVIKELQAWFPALNPLGVAVCEGAVVFLCEDGVAITTGNDIELLLGDMVTKYEWGAFLPGTSVLGVAGHELVTSVNGGLNLLMPYSKVNASQPLFLSTHTVDATAFYSDPESGLYFANGNQLYRWGCGGNMLARWRSAQVMQDGLWRPTVFKVSGGFPILSGRSIKAAIRFGQWRKTFCSDDVDVFLLEYPEFLSVRPQLAHDSLVRVRLYADGRLWYSRPVWDANPHRTPHQGKAIEWSFEIETNHDIYEFHYESSSTELTNI